MKILILCIFDETERNKKLFAIHNAHMIPHEHIDYFFIKFDETIEENYKQMGNVLLIKGIESYMNILSKTIKSMHYFMNIKQTHYDFIIRTNISSVFNFEALYRYLSIIPPTNLYMGSVFIRLNRIDIKFGINPTTIHRYNLKNLGFFQGTCIILSNDVATYLLSHAHELKHDIIDDVAIGLFIRNSLPAAYLTFNKMPICTIINQKNKQYRPNSVMYRHKTFNDEEDIYWVTTTFKGACCSA